MNPALLFLVIVTVMTAVVLWIVLRPLLAKRASSTNVDNASGQSNVDALRIELVEARRDQKLGLLSEASLAEAERELETRVLAESQQVANPTAPRYKRTAIALGVLLPLSISSTTALGACLFWSLQYKWPIQWTQQWVMNACAGLIVGEALVGFAALLYAI